MKAVVHGWKECMPICALSPTLTKWGRVLMITHIIMIYYTFPICTLPFLRIHSTSAPGWLLRYSRFQNNRPESTNSHFTHMHFPLVLECSQTMVHTIPRLWCSHEHFQRALYPVCMAWMYCYLLNHTSSATSAWFLTHYPPSLSHHHQQQNSWKSMPYPGGREGEIAKVTGAH